MNTEQIERIEHIAKRLATATRVTVLTGAGISAESGVATFRDPNGIWTKFKPEELASMDGFLKNPNLVWQWYQGRRDVLEKVVPNPGHTALAELQRWLETRGGRLTLATQNVDRLHHRAGSTDVLELHGNIVENYCSRCRKPHEYVFSDNPDQREPPRCTYCGGQIRPAVVWFGELLPVDVLAAAEAASEQCDVFFSIGTSAEVYPAAGLPIVAKRNGAFLVEINPNATALTRYADVVLHAASGAVLPQIIEALSSDKEQTTND